MGVGGRPPPIQRQAIRAHRLFSAEFCPTKSPSSAHAERPKHAGGRGAAGKRREFIPFHLRYSDYPPRRMLQLLSQNLSTFAGSRRQKSCHPRAGCLLVAGTKRRFEDV